MSGMNSRWRKGAQRQSPTQTMELARWVDGRLERKKVTEVAWVEAHHEAAGWRHGARLRKA